MGRVRFPIFSFVIVLVAGCGASSSSSPAPDVRPPSYAAPRTRSIKGPPPAWVETSRGSRWLGYSSFCWGTTCADFIPPRCGERHTPTLRVPRGETIRFHLGFTPTDAAVTVFGPSTPRERHHLEPSRTPSWRVETAGAFSLFARIKGGDASYVACVRFT
jgi:hypothetical protein